MSQTNKEYANVINVCRDIFSKKTKDYGTAWRVLRPSSLTDQIFIKAQRIRSLQERACTFHMERGNNRQQCGIGNNEYWWQRH